MKDLERKEYALGRDAQGIEDILYYAKKHLAELNLKCAEFRVSRVESGSAWATTYNDLRTVDEAISAMGRLVQTISYHAMRAEQRVRGLASADTDTH